MVSTMSNMEKKEGTRFSNRRMRIVFSSGLNCFLPVHKDKYHFRQSISDGINCNDGLVMFKGKKEVQDIIYWLGGFQHIVNKAVEHQQLQFTAEIWPTILTSLPLIKKYNIKISVTGIFPFLDVNTSWSPKGGLQFGISRKRDRS